MSSALHLLKLSVGTDSVEHLEGFIKHRAAAHGRPFHTTRMVPKRADELLDGGSIYWVIKGQVQARQRLEEIDVFTDGEGIRRCRLVLAPKLVRTQWQPRRPFQGWRYLKQADIPDDLTPGEQAIPAELRAELSELGLM